MAPFGGATCRRGVTTRRVSPASQRARMMDSANRGAAMELVPSAYFSRRMSDAFDYARALHAKQVRKGTTVPYIGHLLAVTALVIEHGGDEDQAMAALL